MAIQKMIRPQMNPNERKWKNNLLLKQYPFLLRYETLTVYLGRISIMTKKSLLFHLRSFAFSFPIVQSLSKNCEKYFLYLYPA